MAKFAPPSSMNRIASASSSGLFQKANEASWVENPAVETVLRAWQIASNRCMPPIQ